jgi:hypothetical protein
MNTVARQLLENYPFYKFAIAGYEAKEPELGMDIMAKYQYAAPARVVLYSDMPMGTGSGSRAPKLTGMWQYEDNLEYRKVKKAVERTECALDLLTVVEREVIILKYMGGLTLAKTGERKHYSREWAKGIHRRAIAKLNNALMFDEVPIIDKTLPPIVTPKRANIVS